MAFESLLFEKAGGVATVTFNRPKVFNAYNFQMSGELKEVMKLVAEDPALRVLILTGGDNYMAGADITMLKHWTAMAEEKGAEEVRRHLDEHFTPNMLEALPIPVIAAIDGYCFGMGMEVSMACDFRIATERSVFCQPEINVGIITGAGSSQRLPRLIGRARASEMIMTGKNFTAPQLYEWGWLNYMVKPEALKDEVAKLVKAILAKSPLMVRLAKETIVKSWNAGVYDGVRFELDNFARVFASADAKEGTAAFLERRKPNFTGK